MRRPFLLAALALSGFAVAQYKGAVPPPAAYKKGFESIQEAQARQILGYLAGPETQGRGTGQPGFQKAAEFVAAYFKTAGLKPLGDDGTYFQNAIFYRPSVSLTIGYGDPLGSSLLALTPTGKAIDTTGDVVLLRAGAADRLDAEGLKALNGKIVVALLPEGRTAIARQLGRADLKAFLTVVDRVAPLVPRALMRKPTAGATSRVSGQIARGAFAAFGEGAETFAAGTGNEIATLDLKRDAHLTARGEIEEVKVPNVVGMVEGSDPTLKAEYVGIGGHLDHLGITDDGTVYPGADDDGSGSTAVMLIAQAVAANPVKPKRSLVFMAFFGEEMGLLGSKYLVDHPPVSLDKMVAELQMDMVGRDSEGVQNGDESRVDKREENVDTIRLVGSKRISTGLDRTIQEMNKYVGFRFKYDAEDVYERSDHYNFAAKGIPIAFLFDGFHPDYHQPTDTIDKIDWNKLTNAARLYYLTLMKIANDPQAPVKDVKGWAKPAF